MTREEAIKDIQENIRPIVGGKSLDMAIEALKADPKEIFYDGYAYCLMDFGKDTVLCRDCKHLNKEEMRCFNTEGLGYRNVANTDFCSRAERRDEVEE